MSLDPSRSLAKSLALLAAAVVRRTRRAPPDPHVPKSLQTLFENATVGMMLVGRDGRFCRVNDCTCEMSGYSREELLQLTPADLSPPEDRVRNRAEQEGVLRGEIEAYDNERRIRRKDGRELWVHVSASLVDDDGSDPHGARAVVVAIDLTSRKAAERERARALEVLELGDPCYVLDPQLRFVLVNSAFEGVARVARKDVVGRSIGDVLPAVVESGGRYWNELQRVVRERVPSGFEEYDERLDVWTDVRLYPMADGGVASVLRDVTSRKRAASERESLLAALEERDRRKDEFLAMLSHELRNPLAPMQSALYVLEHGSPSGKHAGTALAVIGRQVRHMTRMIDDLVDVTRISRGKIRLQRGTVDVAQLVRSAADDYRGILASAGVELAVQVPDTPLLIDGDATRIGQVIGNLLQNAVKFAPRGGHARLRAERDGNEVVVRMEDDGPGIPPAMLAYVFEPFVQADQTLDRKKGGLGLGLALVKGLVEMHGGTATASRSEEGGAAFIVRLPLAAGEHAPVPETRPAHAQGRRVLVVEDNVDAAQTLKLALELDHHVVEVASAGPEGVEKARSFHPDVVLCDLGLPGLDGYGVARTLRSDPDLSSAYLVALSGYAFEQDVQNAHRAGFDEHMSKPPDLEALAQIIARASPGPPADYRRARAT